MLLIGASIHPKARCADVPIPPVSITC